jgi:hypothetical protein
MTQFKQILGRGTRIREDYGKLYFTVMDFKARPPCSQDPEFDGEPVEVYQPGEDDPILPLRKRNPPPVPSKNPRKRHTGRNPIRKSPRGRSLRAPSRTRPASATPSTTYPSTSRSSVPIPRRAR